MVQHGGDMDMEPNDDEEAESEMGDDFEG